MRQADHPPVSDYERLRVQHYQRGDYAKREGLLSDGLAIRIPYHVRQRLLCGVL